MNRFLAVADVLGWGELVEVKGWETRRLASCGPLIKRNGPRGMCALFEESGSTLSVSICLSPSTRSFP